MESPREGRGTARFVLGRGTAGIFGDVELFVQVWAPPGVSVEWRAGDVDDDDLRSGLMLAAEEYGQKYCATRPDLGLRIVILAASRDRQRRNDYARAIALAMHSAVMAAGLPIPQIFADPRTGNDTD
jgi:hypothetical protein